MNDTPNRARTEREDDDVLGKENDKSAPAWMGEGEEVPGKEREVMLVEMLMLVGLDVEMDL